MVKFRPTPVFLIGALAITGALALTGCKTGGNMLNKTNMGSVIGAAVGGTAASQLARDMTSGNRSIATGVGTVAGLMVGRSVGQSMDEVDRMKADSAFQQATHAPIGEDVQWNNPRTGNQGSYVPVRDGYSNSGRYCREFQTQVQVAGESQQGYGTACRQPDGSWQMN